MKKHRFWRTLGIVLAVLLVVIGVGPFLVPVPPLEGTRPIAELADADSLFIDLDGLSVHYKTTGRDEPVFILLHGFGASLYSWDRVMESFGDFGRVIAYDRPGFGLTDRPLAWEGESPYSAQAQVDLLLDLMDALGIERAILVGNSAGGTIAMQFTLQHAERVEALILVDPAVFSGGGAPAWTRGLLRTPQMRHLGPLIARQIQVRGPQLLELAWYDVSAIPAETLVLYEKPLQVENWDKALWEMTLASQESDLDTRLDEFSLPVLVLTGDTDRIVPTEQSIRLAGELPHAALVVIPQAGHVPHEEQPDLFIQAVSEFLSTLP
jgi:pimeloyl-ACP methyl ester carboxylesterase